MKKSNQESNVDKRYGVWCFSERDFENGADISYSNAMGLALFCVEEDEFGVKNFAVIAMDDNKNPIWHEMIWCGQFHGYDFLYRECIRLGEISEREGFDPEDIVFI